MKAVILARGLGTRMRKADAGASLTAAQAAAADSGAKAMMPLGDGRPFIHYVLSALADGGVDEACLVTAPEVDGWKRHLEDITRRLSVRFATQPEPLGTADALLTAEALIAGERFLMLNGDNYYPVDAFRSLVGLGGAGTVGFDRDVLAREGNVAPERIRKFALLEVASDGTLVDIVEKPDESTFSAMDPYAPVSMNLWAFTPEIFDACRRVELSPRGELELPDAVRIALHAGMRIVVVPCAQPVLDLASRGDVASVTDRLAHVKVRL